MYHIQTFIVMIEVFYVQNSIHCSHIIFIIEIMGGCTTRDGIDGHSHNGSSAPFWKQFEINPPSLLCSQSYDVANMCISRTCGAISLYCDNPNCPACPKVHPHCGSVKLEVITGMLQKRAEYVRQMVVKMQEIEIKTFQSIQNRRISLLQNFFLNGFEEKYADMIDSVYYGRKIISMNGDMAEQFYWRLKESNTKLQRVESEMIKYFKRQIERIAAPAIRLEEEVLDQYLKRARVMTMEAEKLVENSQSQIAEKTFKSKILPNNNSEEVKFIEEALDFPKRFKLIFTASEQNFKASRFHEICDNVPHTFTLAETEFGRIIGGYTPLTWNCAKGFACDEESLGFLVSVDLKQKFTLTRPEKAIQCHPEYGPVFGSGADLAISDQCNINIQSCVNFPYSYNYKNNYKYGQQAWTMLSGAREGKTFRIKEYQVYEVIW